MVVIVLRCRARRVPQGKRECPALGKRLMSCKDKHPVIPRAYPLVRLIVDPYRQRSAVWFVCLISAGLISKNHTHLGHTAVWLGRTKVTILEWVSGFLLRKGLSVRKGCYAQHKTDRWENPTHGNGQVAVLSRLPHGSVSGRSRRFRRGRYGDATRCLGSNSRDAREQRTPHRHRTHIPDLQVARILRVFPRP